MPATIRGQRLLALPIAILMAFVLALSLSAPADAAGQRQRKIHHALKIAKHQKGDPYRYGARGPHRFDCSGLTQFAYRRAGLRLPRTSDAQANRTRRIPRRKMRKGDLMFFHHRGDVYHVGIFAGWNGHQRRKVLHSPRPGSRVHTTLVWTGRWFAGTRR